MLADRPGFPDRWIGTPDYWTISRYDLAYALWRLSERAELEMEVAGLVSNLKGKLREPYLDLIDIGILVRRNDG